MGGSGPAETGTGAAPLATPGEVLSRVDRVVREGAEAQELARTCAELRESVFQLVDDGQLGLPEARRISRGLDEVVARALENAHEPARALEALDRALDEDLDALPRLAVEGAGAADSAALLVLSQGKLTPRAFAGVEDATPLGAEGTVAAAALARGEAVHLRTAARHPWALAEKLEGTRALYAVPITHGSEVIGVLRIGSRTAWEFGPHDLRLFRALASRAGALLGPNAMAVAQEARARHAIRTFDLLIEAAPLAIIAFDDGGLIRIWNRAAEELFGWRREDVLGRQNPTVPAELADEARQLFTVLHAGKIVRDREVRRVRRDGTVAEVLLSAAPLHDAQGRLTGSISILQDLSLRQQSEAAAERTARFREQLLGVVGHDLRSPLSAIGTAAQLLLRYSSLAERERRVVERISASAERMTRMIEELLDFTRTRLGGAFPIATRRMNLQEVTEQCVEELSLAHPERHVELNAEGDLWGDWDPGRIAQVVSNLVGNAMQYGSADTPVQIVLRAEDDAVVFETRNQGPPIPPEVLPHVFEPGRRGEGTRTAGLGLGLYIAEQIVRAHEGTIEASSNAQEGTRFTVRLPRRGRHKA